jgi:DNA-binding LytR/AlgR family response regulator
LPPSGRSFGSSRWWATDRTPRARSPSTRPIIAFLDIRMPGATGLDVARQLSGARRPRVVFVTAFDQYAIDAFEADAADYLLKPVTDERLERAVDKLKAGLAANQPAPELATLLAQLSQQFATNAQRRLRWIRASKRAGDGEVTEQIAVADVLYFQADDKYTCVYARDGEAVREWLIRVPLSELAAQLDGESFQQIHRSVIVNLNAVAGTRRAPVRAPVQADVTGAPARAASTARQKSTIFSARIGNAPGARSWPMPSITSSRAPRMVRAVSSPAASGTSGSSRP